MRIMAHYFKCLRIMLTHFSKCFFIILIVLLQSCQSKNDASTDESSQNDTKVDHAQAASYNIQLGIAYLKQGNVSRAKKKLLLALKQAPHSPDAHASMAYFLEKTGSVHEASAYYLKALSLSANQGKQLNNYGAYLCRQGDYQKAIAYFLKASSDPQYLHVAGAYENAGLCALQIPDKIKAADYFKQALAHDPKRKQSLLQLVEIDKSQKQFKETLSLLQKYPEITYYDRSLLQLGIELARKAGETTLASDYQQRLYRFNVLSNTGVNDDDDSDNG